MNADGRLDVEGFVNAINRAFPGAASYSRHTTKDLSKPVAEWVSANRGITAFSYEFELNSETFFGGIELKPKSHLKHQANSWANDTWIANDEAELNRWLSGIPFCCLRNSDFLAFESAEAGAPVLYLCHDDTSRVIAPSFKTFEHAWSFLGYIGPEIWVLDPFLDFATGFLRHDTEQAADHRRRFLDIGVHL